MRAHYDEHTHDHAHAHDEEVAPTFEMRKKRMTRQDYWCSLALSLCVERALGERAQVKDKIVCDVEQ